MNSAHETLTTHGTAIPASVTIRCFRFLESSCGRCMYMNCEEFCAGKSTRDTSVTQCRLLGRTITYPYYTCERVNRHG